MSTSETSKRYNLYTKSYNLLPRRLKQARFFTFPRKFQSCLKCKRITNGCSPNNYLGSNIKLIKTVQHITQK